MARKKFNKIETLLIHNKRENDTDYDYNVKSFIDLEKKKFKRTDSISDLTNKF